MTDAAASADVALCARRLARRYPDWFPAMAIARQEALAQMMAEIGPADHTQFHRAVELAAGGDHHAAAAAMLMSEWGQSQRAWRIGQTMRTGVSKA